MIVTINGKPCECQKGEFLLQIAQRNGIEIPTLCHHDSLPGQGCCRLCIVEVIERGRGKIVVSCVYPVEKECEVLTDSEKVQRQRGLILTLLHKRAPDSEVISELCQKYHAPEIPRLQAAEAGKCIMCGLCVRACSELSIGAISTISRGVTKEIATPYHEPSTVCVGCGSCASICPTGAIDIQENSLTRTIWGKTFQLVHCKQCGKAFGTQEELEMVAKRSGQEPETLCKVCREKKIASAFAQIFGG